MTDIVTILRRVRLPEGYNQTMLDQAAEEIEQLRNQVDNANQRIEALLRRFDAPS